jgi:ATP-binding cassette subfamily F protein uup
MDEPTNDLDAETLDLLEDLLMNYSGTLLLVSHDRAFLNNVVTSSIVFDDDGVVREYVGGYDDWLRQRAEQKKPADKVGSKPTQPSKTAARKKSTLTYQEQLDLKALPAKIEELEARQQAFNEQMSDPAFYQQDADKISEVQKQVAVLEAEMETAFERWEVLEEKQNS